MRAWQAVGMIEMHQRDISFRCFYEDGHYTQHTQKMGIEDVSFWCAAYKVTHPACTSISVKMWFEDGEGVLEDGNS